MTTGQAWVDEASGQPHLQKICTLSDPKKSLPTFKLGSVFDDLQAALELADIAADMADMYGAPATKIATVRKLINQLRTGEE